MSDKNNLINQCLYCDHCKNKMKYILSDLNSYYYYCERCDYNNETVQKHMLFDSILKYINENLVEIIYDWTEEINIYIYKYKNKLLLNINNYKSIEFNAIDSITENDLSIFSNTLSYIIDDILGEETLKVSVSYKHIE